jgi:ABC-type transport system involved in multi-copper enzyme maturation permease subunit
LVTSEWSQRTALITFALVPHRARIVSAKILALALALALGLVVLVLCVGLSLLGTAVGGSDDPARGDLSAALLGGTAIYLLTAMIQGVAFGAAIRSSAPAIVAYFVLLANGDSLGATEWARVGTSLLLWMMLPLGVGILRLLRGEVRA